MRILPAYTGRRYGKSYIMITNNESETFEKIASQIRTLTGYTAVQRIPMGFSFDEKYVLSGSETKRYLVKITVPANPKIILKKQKEFDLIQKLRQYSSLVQNVYIVGTSDDEDVCFMVLDFIEGIDGTVALNGMSDADQYRNGVLAGKEQKKMHALPAPVGMSGWYEVISAKYSRKVAAFDKLKIRLPGIDREHLSRYIRKNISCIRDTSRVFLHRDYHPANIIIDNGQLSGIIDFSRYE